jgi:hypothetical protein
MHLLTQSVHVLPCSNRPWRVIMGPTEYCTMILLPKPTENLPHFSLFGTRLFKL